MRVLAFLDGIEGAVRIAPKDAIGGAALARYQSKVRFRMVLRLRKALNTANWELATEMARSMETGGVTAAMTVDRAVERFLADAAARNLTESSLKKCRVLLQGRRGREKSSPTLEEFAEDQGYRLLKQLDVDALREFRQHWKMGRWPLGKSWSGCAPSSVFRWRATGFVRIPRWRSSRPYCTVIRLCRSTMRN